jgi:hypothetical protein
MTALRENETATSVYHIQANGSMGWQGQPREEMFAFDDEDDAQDQGPFG